MRKVLCIGLLSLVSAAALAAPTPQSACRVNYRGETIDVTNGDEFFQTANQIAQRENVCVHAKIAYVQNSGRVYSGRQNGALLADYSGKKKGLSNKEADEAASRAGEYCMTLSCDEIGILHNDEPISNEIPPVIINGSSSGGY